MKKRFWWGFRYITGDTEKEVTFTGTAGSPYEWVYIDGDEDLDGTLTVKNSTVQPMAKVLEKTQTIPILSVSVDDAVGTITGYPYQLYVELAVPATSVETAIVSVKEGGVLMTNAYLVNRWIVALGQCNIDGNIEVKYMAYDEPWILACVKLNDVTGDILDVHRTFSRSNHVRSYGQNDLNQIEVYFEFADWAIVGDKEISTLRDIMDAILPVTKNIRIFVNYGGQQWVVGEDDGSWRSLYKGYRLAKLTGSDEELVASLIMTDVGFSTLLY